MSEIKECYYPLLGKIAQNGMTQEDYANKLGISRTSLYHRLRGKRTFTVDNIKKTVNIFDLSPDEMMSIFFTN